MWGVSNAIARILCFCVYDVVFSINLKSFSRFRETFGGSRTSAYETPNARGSWRGGGGGGGTTTTTTTRLLEADGRCFEIRRESEKKFRNNTIGGGPTEFCPCPRRRIVSEVFHPGADRSVSELSKATRIKGRGHSRPFCNRR